METSDHLAAIDAALNGTGDRSLSVPSLHAADQPITEEEEETGKGGES